MKIFTSLFGGARRHGEPSYPFGTKGTSTSVARPLSGKGSAAPRNLLWLMVIVLGSNFFSHMFLNPKYSEGKINAPVSGVESSLLSINSSARLFLMDKAALFVKDLSTFEHKVKEISSMLRIAPEWLMAVMYSESRFNSAVLNHKGSGATGLIQFMPATAGEMNISMERLRRMTPEQQLEYVYIYLQTVRDRYGDFHNLTDLYLGVLYPKAINQDYCYTLYAKPSKAYKQNSGLDYNKDGRVTVSDIDRRMKDLYPEAYMARFK